LSKRPEHEHESIVAFKQLAFEGMIARAEAEVAWAERGLAVIDELEATQAATVSAGKR
jgi:glycerol kinase